MIYKKKLIEVALPLDSINIASAREKSIRHGHPSTLHLWWSRKPLATCRAVIFAQMVDDPSEHPDEFPTIEAQESERQRLFKIIEKLVLWESTTDENILQEARTEIWRSWRRTCYDNRDHPQAKELFNPDKLPALHDPFAGGGSIPLEAQRLGLEAYASDLNPVAVIINKAMIEIPPKFANKPPVNPLAKSALHHEYRGAQGLAEDVRYYGQWMRDEAEKRIGHLYPKYKITDELIAERPDLEKYRNRELTVIAYIWARTVKSPSPAYAHIDVPLAPTFYLSTKTGKEAYIHPIIENEGYRFTVRVGKPDNWDELKNGTKLARGANFQCLITGNTINGEFIKSEAKAGRMNDVMMAVVAEGDNCRVYLPPTEENVKIARSAIPKWKPDGVLEGKSRDQLPLYGVNQYSELFTPRQLTALTTFSDLVHEAREKILEDMGDKIEKGKPLDEGGTGPLAYAQAVSVYLAFAVSKSSDNWSSFSTARNNAESTAQLFKRQAIAMNWDFMEFSPFSEKGGSFSVSSLRNIAVSVENLFCSSNNNKVIQENAINQTLSRNSIVSTDPPYYDNIGYADLSDFFFIWLKSSLNNVYKNLFNIICTPKAEELIASHYRHKTKKDAEDFFLSGMKEAIRNISEKAHSGFPLSIYYAFKQADNTVEGVLSTGWATFLEALIHSGLSITGTWPMRTEGTTRLNALKTNALASSIVLVCRKRDKAAPECSRKEFITALNNELPGAVLKMTKSNIAPVDLAQASLGPGMTIFTRYSKVVDAQGNQLRVKDALALINQTLDEVLNQQEGEYDADTRWAIQWFTQYGFDEGLFGEAETLTKAKNTSVSGLVESGIVQSVAGKVRLLKSTELNPDWDPTTDRRRTIWEIVHQLVRTLNKFGVDAAGALLHQVGSDAEIARDLAYQLYAICDRKKRAQIATDYNALVQNWADMLERKSPPRTKTSQSKMDFDDEE